MKSREVIRRLEREGWEQVRQSGSHRIFRHPDKAGRVNVPDHTRDVPIGTLRAIYTEAGWEWDQR